MTDLEQQLRSMIREIVREEIKTAIDEAKGDEYLSTSKAAELADVAEGTIRRWIREGRITKQLAGRCLRVSRADLEKMLRSGSDHANDETPEQMARREFG